MKTFRLNAGTDLLATIGKACSELDGSEAWVRATGTLRSVHIVGPNDETLVVHSSPCVLASFDAHVGEGGALATCVISYAASGVPVVVAGRVKAAVASDVRVTILSDSPAAPEPVEAVAAPESAEAPSPAEPANPWAQVAAVSAAVSEDDEEEEVDVDELSRGDVLLHPTLGRCRMVGAINDSAIKVRLPNGSTRKLMMRVFSIRRRGSNEYELVKA